MCDVFSCITLTVCHNRPLLCSGCLYIYLQLTLNVIQQASLCVQTKLSVSIFTSAVRTFNFPDRAEGSKEKTSTLQVRLRVLCCVEAGIVEYLKGWRSVVRGVWWEGWRCVEGVEQCRGRGEACGGRSGGVWWEG